MANAGKFLLHYYLQNYLDTIERRVLPDEYWLRYTVARNQRGVEAPADPIEMRYIDPEPVTYNTSFHPHLSWRKLGAVRGGGWDLDAEPLEEKVEPKLSILEARYEEEQEWEDIEAVYELIESGREWHEHYGEDIWEWCEKLDQLYESIRTRGYHAKRELLGLSFSEACSSTSVTITEWLDDVLIDISRDGELYRHEGKHRLWFANHFGFDQIPVCILVRHEEWQDLRDEMATADSVDDLSEEAYRRLDHPDMIDVRPDGHRESLDPERSSELSTSVSKQV